MKTQADNPCPVTFVRTQIQKFLEWKSQNAPILTEYFKNLSILNGNRGDFESFWNNQPLVENTNGFWFENYLLIQLSLIFCFIIFLGIVLLKKATHIKILNLLSAYYLIVFLTIITLLPYLFNWINIYEDSFRQTNGFFVSLFFFLAISTIIIFFLGISDIFFIDENTKLEFSLLIWSIFLAAIFLISSTDFIVIIILLECIAFSSYILVGFSRKNKFSTTSALKYLILASIPSCLFILAIALLYYTYGSFLQEYLNIVYNSSIQTFTPELWKNLNVHLLKEISFNQIEKLVIAWQNFSEKGDLFKTHSTMESVKKWGIEYWLNARYQSILNDYFMSFSKMYFPAILEHIAIFEYILENKTNFLINNVISIEEFLYYEIMYQYFYELYFIQLDYWLLITTTWFQNLAIFSENTVQMPYSGPGLASLIFFQHLIHWHFFLNFIGLSQIVPEFFLTTFNLPKNLEIVFQNLQFPSELDFTMPEQLTYLAELLNMAFGKNYYRVINFDDYLVVGDKRLLSAALIDLQNYEVELLPLWYFLNFFTNPNFIKQPPVYLTEIFEYFLCFSEFSANYANTLNIVKCLDVKNCTVILNYVLENDFQYLYYSTNVFLILYLIILFILSNLLFKLTAAPFHFWAPTVYGGSPLATLTFLSIFSKLTIFFFVIWLFITSFDCFKEIWQPIIFVVAFLSIFFSILGAFSEKIFKRFFVYSSMGHVGFMLLGIAILNIDGLKGTFDYIVLYIVSSFIIWFLVLFLTKKTITLINFKGFFFNFPLLAIIFALTLFSLSGIPPMGGFFVKYEIFYSLLNSSFFYFSYILLFLTIISFFYYLRLIKIIFFENNKLFSKNKNLTDLKLRIIIFLFFLIPFFLFFVQTSFAYIIKETLIESLYFITMPDQLLEKFNYTPKNEIYSEFPLFTYSIETFEPFLNFFFSCEPFSIITAEDLLERLKNAVEVSSSGTCPVNGSGVDEASTTQTPVDIMIDAFRQIGTTPINVCPPVVESVTSTVSSGICAPSALPPCPSDAPVFSRCHRINIPALIPVNEIMLPPGGNPPDLTDEQYELVHYEARCMYADCSYHPDAIRDANLLDCKEISRHFYREVDPESGNFRMWVHFKLFYYSDWLECCKKDRPDCYIPKNLEPTVKSERLRLLFEKPTQNPKP